MIIKDFFRSYRVIHIRYYSKSAPKPSVIVDHNVLKDIENEVYKPRKHPGIMRTKTVNLPDNFIKAALRATEDFPVKALIESSDKLSRHLRYRVTPLEKAEYKERVHQIQEKILTKYEDYEIKNEEDAQRLKQIITDKVNYVLKEKIYNWKPMKYDTYLCLVYMLSRFAPEYSVLLKIFGEIAHRDPQFVPRSFFDFGSGVGSGTWAANVYWHKHIFEYFNVDVSADMNDLAQILLQGGTGTGESKLKGIFYRQFLPTSNNNYDIVLSAYSLFELPSLETRLQTVLNLWNKTEKYLVIVEQGTNAGFKVINEVRDFILQISKDKVDCHIFSPCPHEAVCPRFMADDGTPCNFEVSYYNLPIGRSLEILKERYCYVVLKKGKRNEYNKQWPRIIRPTLVRSKHTICRMCTANEKIEEVIFTAKKHGKLTYHCARSSQWGDLLPIHINPNTSEVS
ncbi:ribosome assembly protein METTL17, mitochondrial [Rhynchophorus ferrugineus]|uniref:Methyltransferase-like protein 17, mitochondrial n=1 Tax=Rhynchophorus ferrugineus TaxID=354439 RepID=A0A834MG88_RHYFE|nr:hypothetical protein GWI33_005240 [Rhynchophorus ferrugineus]